MFVSQLISGKDSPVHLFPLWAVHLILIYPVHLKVLQGVHLIRCYQFIEDKVKHYYRYGHADNMESIHPTDTVIQNGHCAVRAPAINKCPSALGWMPSRQINLK